jgi:hypothetical protein
MAQNAPFQFSLPRFLLPLPILFSLQHPFSFLLGTLSKCLDSLGEFIAHAVLDFITWIFAPFRLPSQKRPTRTKKADVVEHPKAFDHVGVLTNEPPGSAKLLFI